MGKQPLRLLANQRGVALIMAVSALTLVLWLAMEGMYETNVEYVVNANAINELKAHYAAKAGMELSLVRIKIYQKVREKIPANSPVSNMIEEIWRFPFAWPLPIAPDMAEADKDQINDLIKASSLDSSFVTQILDEGSKIDVSDLVSPSKVLRESTRRLLLNIFQSRINSDDDFRTRYASFDFNELINNIADWMSSSTTSLNGGDKKAKYRDYGTQELPPNRGFRTLGEMRMVPGMTEEIFQMLEPRVTIYGNKGINPNTASAEVLMSLDPGIDREVIDKLMQRRNDPQQPPFQSAEEFWVWMNANGARLENPDVTNIPLIFDTISSFRIISTGEYNGVTREMTAVVLDINKTASRLKKFTDKEKTEEQRKAEEEARRRQPQPPTPTPPAPAETVSKGPPRIVYFFVR